MKPFRTVRPRPLATIGITVTIALAASGAASATTEPPASDPATTVADSTAPDLSAGPDVSAAPGGAPGILLETTYTFTDGEYHWVSDYGSVPRAAGDLQLAAGDVTMVAVTNGVVGVAGGDGAVAEVAEGTAVARPEDDTTALSAIDAAFGAFTTIDLQSGADPEGGATFTPGPGERELTLSHVVVEPGAALDVSSLGGDAAYVVVVKGIVDAGDGTELVPHDALAWTADAGPLAFAPRSANVGAELLVVTVSPAA